MNEKLKKVLRDLMITWTHLRYGYSSSAKEFSDKLSKKGIVLPIKLFYEYKLPNDISPKDYEIIVQEINFYTMYFKGELNDPDILKFYDPQLSDSEKEILESYILQRQGEYDKKLELAVAQVRLLNPELNHIKIDKKISGKLCFLEGVNYGFAPEEIEYFLNRKLTNELLEQENKEFNELEKLLGFVPEYVLDPKHMQIILTAARTYNKKIHKRGGEELIK